MVHHAYLVCGARESGIAHACELFALSEERKVGNPDVQIFHFEQFGIDDARRLEEWAQQKPVREARRLFIISVEQMLHEAQSALLKLFEEPPKESAFVLIVPNLERILPTLRSRFETVVLGEAAEQALAEEFLALSFAERLKEIGQRMKDRDTAWVESLLSSLETYAHKDVRIKGDGVVDREVKRALLFTRTYIARRGASQKMLLEHLALALP
jgi:DNA polymerase III delta prime subunit